MKEWKGYWSMLDQSIIIYDVRFGRVYGGSDPNRAVKHGHLLNCHRCERMGSCLEHLNGQHSFYPGGDLTMELD